MGIQIAIGALLQQGQVGFGFGFIAFPPAVAAMPRAAPRGSRFALPARARAAWSAGSSAGCGAFPSFNATSLRQIAGL
jgi:hypothetical protein